MVKVKEIVPTETFRAIARKVNIRFIEKFYIFYCKWTNNYKFV